PGAGDVRAEVVALHQVVLRTRVGDQNARPRTDQGVEAVPRDQVAGRRRGPADGVVHTAATDQDAGEAVAQGGGAGGVRANAVALDQVVVAAIREDNPAPESVGRDDVAGAGRRPADGVAGRRHLEEDAETAVAQRERTGAVGADVVALHQVAGRVS